MKLIEGLYIAFYRFSNFFRENVPGSFLYNQRFDSILILSILTLLNFSSLWILLDLKPLLHQFFCSGSRFLVTVKEGVNTQSAAGQKAAIEVLDSLKDPLEA